MSEFFGLYRGVVRVNDDSNTVHPNQGCIKVYVPQVYGKEITNADLPWAYPCFSLGGGRVGKSSYGIIAIPPVTASVWVAFELGDPGHPVWLGCWYGERDIGDGVAQEMPDEAVEGYPSTILIKDPTSENSMIFRIVSGSKIEIASHTGQTRVTLNRNGDVEVKTISGKIEVQSTEGAVELISGEDDDEQSIKMDPGELTMQLDAKALTIRAGSIELRAENSIIFGAENLYGHARHASGFEKH